jgi:glutaminase
VPSDLFGVCMVDTNGNVYAVGDTDHPFSIMSVSKPFVFALVCQSIGGEQAREKLGANSTGLPFNSFAALERSVDGRTNPMVNAGAIATTSLVPGGGIVTVSPGKGGLGTFSPPLDSAGNSVKGQLVAKFLSQRLGMDLFVSEPEK